MTTKTWDLILMSDLVKVGVHEEEGYDIIRERWYMGAEAPSGRRFRHGALLDQHEAEERLALLILDGGVDPERSDGWEEMYPVYGSEYFQANQAQDAADERLAEDAAMAEMQGSVAWREGDRPWWHKSRNKSTGVA
jgi:hypothetical protein